MTTAWTSIFSRLPGLDNEVSTPCLPKFLSVENCVGFCCQLPTVKIFSLPRKSITALFQYLETLRFRLFLNSFRYQISTTFSFSFQLSMFLSYERQNVFHSNDLITWKCRCLWAGSLLLRDVVLFSCYSYFDDTRALFHSFNQTRFDLHSLCSFWTNVLFSPQNEIVEELTEFLSATELFVFLSQWFWWFYSFYTPGLN